MGLFEGGRRDLRIRVVKKRAVGVTGYHRLVYVGALAYGKDRLDKGQAGVRTGPGGGLGGGKKEVGVRKDQGCSHGARIRLGL